MKLRLLSWLRSRATGRQTAQQMVEISLAVALISITGIGGLSVLGRAEEGYFIPLANDLGRPADATDHQVGHQTSITWSCNSSRTVAAGDVINCSPVLVHDSEDPPGQSSPTDGQVEVVEQTAGTIPFTCAPSYVDDRTSRCDNVTIQVGPSRPQPYVFFARFVPLGTHRYSETAPINIQVQPSLQLNTQCSNPWYLSWGTTVEPGHPLTCSVQVLDKATLQPYNQAIAVTWTPDLTRRGWTYFYCHTTDPAYNTAACQAPAMPLKNEAGSCTARPPQARCKIEFRRGFDDNTMISTGSEILRAVAAPTDNPAENSSDIQISIANPPNAHPVRVTTSCTGGLSGSRSDPVYARPWDTSGMMVPTMKQLNVVLGTTLVTCTAVVFDNDANANAVLDAASCTNPTPPACDPNASDAHAPLGPVTRIDQNNSPIPVASGTCRPLGPGLGHQGSRPSAMVPNQIGGQPEYASWCDSTFTVPAGTTQITARYEGEQGLPRPAHTPGTTSDLITVN